MPRGAPSARRAALSTIIHRRRLDAGLTQKDVAQILGRPQSFVADLESSTRKIEVTDFFDVARAVGFDALEALTEFAQSDTDERTAGSTG
jgi:transcriptional regulator with XRE-family HTH domain